MSYVKIDGLPTLVHTPNASAILNKNYWVLVNNLKFTINIDGVDTIVDIPRGYLTDGATIPRIFWSLIPVWDDCTPAVLLHDYLCNYGMVTKAGELVKILRPEIDRLFLRVLEFSEVASVKYWTMYIAVRAHAKVTGRVEPSISKKKAEMEVILREDLDSGIFMTDAK